ncbi:MAG: FAD-dependent oxidoreductase [Candidatus Aenigmarchaeota archaeon]|nr:FAD-dependent oxidoreductase [Candidatus Aenigmarchaeota archaeon]
MNVFDLIILGAGPAGLSAAIYASRYNLNFLVVRKDKGLASETNEVENYLGIYPVTGLELTNRFETHAKNFGTKIINEEIISIEKKDKAFTVKTINGEYKSRAIIYAVGGKKRKLEVEGEKKFIGKGVSYCATCDAPFFKNKTVGVVGGANAAVEAALLLSEFAQKVYIIYRKDKLRAVPYLVEKIKQRKNIEVLYNNTVKKINGKISVESVKLDNEKELKMDGLFVEIGHVPNYQLAEKLGVKISEDKRVVVDQNMSTNIAGFFAAGDVTTGSNKFDQIITAAAEGAIAASAAYKFILKGDD